MKVIKVGTRKSKLAMTQTQQLADQLKELHPERDFVLVPYTTKGDRLTHVSLQEIGGKGVFVKEIERALLAGEIDMAVHSLKDMPAKLAEGCVLGAISQREDVRDCLIFRQAGQTLANLPEGALIGTSSIRRQVQLQAQRPDLTFKPLRGNIDTRIKKLEEGEYDAIVLAMAGLKRLGWMDQSRLHIQPLETSLCLPAISQGALAVECREEDEELRSLLAAVQDEKTAAEVAVERAVLAQMNADCTFPIAALAQKNGQDYQLEAMLAKEDGQCVFVSLQGQDGQQLAEQAVRQLADKGAVGMPWLKK